VSAWIIVSGKMQYMEREFADYSAAKAAGELEKGWLPSFLPSSATMIKVINNTDQKSSLASFKFEEGLEIGSSCGESPFSEAVLPAERVVLWWPDELTGKGGALPGVFFKCADGQVFVNAEKKEAYFWK